MRRVWNSAQLLEQVEIPKRQPAVTTLVQHTAERPNVRRAPQFHSQGARRPRNSLRAHVVDRAHLAVAHNVGRVVSNGFRYAEVNELEDLQKKKKREKQRLRRRISIN